MKMNFPRLGLVSYLLLGFLLGNVVVHGDIFTSTDRMGALLVLEEKLLKAVDTYIKVQANAERNVEPEWENVYKELKAFHDKDVSRVNFLENPINSYHLARRMTSSWVDLIDYNHIDDDSSVIDVASVIGYASAHGVKKLYTRAKKKGQWPLDNDSKGTALSLVRLSNVYSLNLTELLEGRIYDSQTNPITDDDLFHIVKTLDEKGMYYECLKWLNAGLYRAISGVNKKDAIKFYRNMASIYHRESMSWKALEMTKKALKLAPDNKALKRDIAFFQTRADKVPKSKRKHTIRRKKHSKLIQKYEALCSGKKGTPKNGICQYKKTKIPVYVSKEEILSLDPRISMFYDVIYESEMQHIKDLALKMLSRSVVIGQEIMSDMRISQSAWLKDNDEVISRVTHRVELITGMSLEEKKYSSHSEELQVLNYGIGGMYEPHYDFFNNSNTKMNGESMELYHSGDRVATFLFYLNDVKAGGATVFPEVSVRVPVKKGAAAFWYNLRRHTWGDNRTLHAGCPVLLGSKWVSNKWIRLNGNMFNAKCGLTYDATYEL
ncbi:prolyl 4-hydroxylase subunit alpha-1-like [Liolophura sinensis]|uniref:prolyl 4-hydroxylase subunit alpha-1-like n=1 Tax=Liolophura sinensis TaxID=3198878 RepID=UPI00315983BE